MSVETIARRYATALADVVLKSGETETVKTELKSWEELIEANENLQTVFGNPSIAHLKKENILHDLLAKVRPTKTTANSNRWIEINFRQLFIIGNSCLLNECIISMRFKGLMLPLCANRKYSKNRRCVHSIVLSGFTGGSRLGENLKGL